MTQAGWIALAAVLLTAFLAAVRGAVTFVRVQDEKVMSKAEHVAGGLKHTIQMLDLTMQSLRSDISESKQQQRQALDQVVREVTYTNDGSTLKGTVVDIRRTADDLRRRVEVNERRLDRLERG